MASPAPVIPTSSSQFPLTEPAPRDFCADPRPLELISRLTTALQKSDGEVLASLVGVVEEDATVVCECSSFQLEDADAFAPDCAVLLNVTPDHLDRHRTMDEYVQAKLRIFRAPEFLATAFLLSVLGLLVHLLLGA